LILAIKIILLLSLSIIFYQDFKDRKVWVFLFPVMAFTGFFLFYRQTILEVFLYSAIINLSIVGILILINYLFARFVLKKKFLKEALGLGDILFFMAFAVSFPTIAFINFFVFSLLFTFVLQFLLKKINTSRYNNIPLAGCMSLFLMVVYTCHWLGFYDSIYIL
jgi:hypothetical protein